MCMTDKKFRAANLQCGVIIMQERLYCIYKELLITGNIILSWDVLNKKLVLRRNFFDKLIYSVSVIMNLPVYEKKIK